MLDVLTNSKKSVFVGIGDKCLALVQLVQLQLLWDDVDDWGRRRRRDHDDRLVDDDLRLVFQQQLVLEFFNLHVVHFFAGFHGPGASQEDKHQSSQNLKDFRRVELRGKHLFIYLP